MKQTVIKLTNTILFSFILVLSSCTDENSNIDNFKINENSKIKEAKHWFEKSKENVLNNSILKEYEFNWEKAESSLLNNGVVEITVPAINKKINKKENYYLYLQLFGKKYSVSFYQLNSRQHPNSKLIDKDKPPIELDEVVIHGSGGSNQSISVIVNTFSNLDSLSSNSGSTNAIGNYGGGGSASGTGTASISGAIAFSNSLARPDTSPSYIQYPIQDDKNQVAAKVTFQITALSEINVFIIQKIGNPFTIENVISSSSGLVLGYTWKQEYFTQSTAKNIITLDVVATFTLGIGIHGIGDFYSTLYKYQIKIDKRTGKIISGQRIN